MKRILIIDDDEGILEATSEILKIEGYHTQTSQNSDIVYELKPDSLPHLIIMDILLSGSDGREVCLYLKQQPLSKKIPILLLSAAPQLQHTVRMTKADGFLEKPFNIKELIKAVQRFI